MDRPQAELQYAFERFCADYDRLFRLPLFEFDTGTAERYTTIDVRENLAVPMRDGIRLYGDLYRPASDDPLPVVLTRLPYGKQEFSCCMPAMGRFWARRGYAFMAQDVRGRYASEGVWEPHRNERDDGYDTLEWISRQPWCNGRIGMMGESYFGYTCWAAAVSGHPQLTCIAASTTAMDIYNVWVYNYGAYCLQSMGDWSIWMNAKQYYQNYHLLDHERRPLKDMAEAAGIPDPYYRQCLEHPTRDEFWEEINLNQFHDRIQIPVLHFGGWYDLFLRATLDDRQGVCRHSRNPEARNNQWLCIGPNDHEHTTEQHHRVGRLQIGSKAALTRWQIQEQFFDYWLRGEPNGFDSQPRVKIFVMGANDWRFENEWPLARTRFTRYYLHSGGSANSLNGDGRLDTVLPEEEPHDRFIYDPLNPVRITQQIDIWRLAENMQDRRAVEIRNDVLVYTSAKLAQDLEITGPLEVRLQAASSACDTDFSATLVDLFPDGYAHLIQEGIMRAGYREGDRSPTAIKPDEIYGYAIDLAATSYIFKAGHRLRVEISSSNFDRFDRHHNTGEPFAQSTTTVKAVQTIYHNRHYPSYIILPVIDP